MLRIALAETIANSMVRDMASHVGDQVHGVLKRHGMLMDTAVGAIGMGLLASIQVLKETLAFARNTMGEGDDADALDMAAVGLFFDMLAEQSILASDWLKARDQRVRELARAAAIRGEMK